MTAALALDRLVAWAEQQRATQAAQPPCRYDFDAQGDLTLIVEPDGNRRAFAYDSQRRLVAVHDAAGSTHCTYDAHDRLAGVDGPSGERRYVYDLAHRLVAVHRGATGGVKYRYDDAGHVLEYRTALVANLQHFDPSGRLVGVAQEIGGVVLQAGLAFDSAGRLATMHLPGHRIDYGWTEAGRPATLALDGQCLATWQLEDRTETIHFSNGVAQRTHTDTVDGRVLERELRRGSTMLDHTPIHYDAVARITHDGRSRYAYDALGRLACEQRDGHAPEHHHFDAAGQRLAGDACAFTWRFDDIGQLTEAHQDNQAVVQFSYDAKGRLATMQTATRHERYFYGPADELLAVTDAQGRVLRAYVHTPSGCLAEIDHEGPRPELRLLHLDRRGACHCVTGADGAVLARHAYTAFGAPLNTASPSGPQPWFGGRRHVPQVGLYRVGARWYDPAAGRFITPDSYTAAPDDERLLHPLLTGAAQVALRAQLLPEWLRHSASRHRFAYCANDPVNRVDPNGHWSFGGVVLSLLGAIWTLPNTVFGLLIEVTCLVGEVVRWLTWLVTAGNVSWATPGFDVASSSNLNAFALVFRGGWLGSFRSLLGITFGNVFFVRHDWEESPSLKAPGTFKPPAYNGTVEIAKKDALYEHELRHTNQYGWLGPFFHLGLPLFGVYEWDVILHGYEDAWTETDAREHAGF
jgi:RHS repeat-associated protein